MEDPIVDDSIILEIISSKILKKGHLLVCKSTFTLWLGRDKPSKRNEHRLRLKEVDVSRSHGFIEWENGFFTFTDNNSSFGSFYNKQRVTSHVRLNHGNILQIGSTVFQVHRHATCPDCSLSLHPIYKTEPPSTPPPDGKAQAMKPEKKTTRMQLRSRPFIPKPSIAHPILKPSIARPIHKQPSIDKPLPSSSRGQHRSTIPVSISNSKPIKSTNKGNSMLRKLGWKPGESLGVGNHIVEPILPAFTLGKRGIGSRK